MSDIERDYGALVAMELDSALMFVDKEKPKSVRISLERAKEYHEQDRATYRGAVEDLVAFAQAVLDMPCPFEREADQFAAQQRRASELITTYGGQ